MRALRAVEKSKRFTRYVFSPPIDLFRSHILELHADLQAKNVPYNPSATPSGKCPHAKAAQQAAAVAKQEAEKASRVEAQRSPVAAKSSGAFDYGGFYETELEKKHKDKSYRYFNNINRLAQDFPRAHMTASMKRWTCGAPTTTSAWVATRRF